MHVLQNYEGIPRTTTTKRRQENYTKRVWLGCRHQSSMVLFKTHFNGKKKSKFYQRQSVGEMTGDEREYTDGGLQAGFY